MSEIFNEEVNKHDPIHSKAYKWEESNNGLPPFKELLINGEIEEDKIYFVEDLTGESDFFGRLLSEINKKIEELKQLIQQAQELNLPDEDDVNSSETIEGE